MQIRFPDTWQFYRLFGVRRKFSILAIFLIAQGLYYLQYSVYMLGFKVGLIKQIESFPSYLLASVSLPALWVALILIWNFRLQFRYDKLSDEIQASPINHREYSFQVLKFFWLMCLALVLSELFTLAIARINHLVSQFYFYDKVFSSFRFPLLALITSELMSDFGRCVSAIFVMHLVFIPWIIYGKFRIVLPIYFVLYMVGIYFCAWVGKLVGWLMAILLMRMNFDQHQFDLWWIIHGADLSRGTVSFMGLLATGIMLRKNWDRFSDLMNRRIFKYHSEGNDSSQLT